MGFEVQRACARSSAVLAFLMLSPVCLAQQFVIGSGASLSLGSSQVDAGCRDFEIAGTLDIDAGSLHGVRDLVANGLLRGGSGLIALSGDLAAAGALQPEGGTVRISDGCGSSDSQLTGNHQFNRLTVQNSASYELVLPAGGTQFIASALELLGGAQRLAMRSTAPGVVSFLSLAGNGTQLVDRVDAIDVGAPPSGQFLAPQEPASYDSIDRGNTPRFLGAEVIVPIPTLSTFGLYSLLLLLVVVALAQLRLLNRGEI